MVSMDRTEVKVVLFFLISCLFVEVVNLDELLLLLLLLFAGAFQTVEEIPENLVHDHEKNGLPRLSSLTQQEINHRWAHSYIDKCGLIWLK